MQNEEKTPCKYLKIKELVATGLYPFTNGQIRAFLMKKHENGLSKCCRLIGKNLYIRADLFHEWVEGHTLDKGAK